jgi:hypothetical protein
MSSSGMLRRVGLFKSIRFRGTHRLDLQGDKNRPAGNNELLLTLILVHRFLSA